MGNEEPYFNQFFAHQENKYSLIIEDNGKVAYAYLLENGDIISEVWLYNNGESLYDNWDSISEDDLPIQNLPIFIEHFTLPIKEDSDVNLKWIVEDSFVRVFVFIRQELIAILSSNEEIGSSTSISVDTPIARLHNNNGFSTH